MTKAVDLGFAGSFVTDRLMRFAVAGRDVWSVDFPRNRGVPLTRYRLEFAGILAGQRDVHELHPDGQGGAGSRLFFAKGFLFVVADPDATGEGWGKAHEPGVGEGVSRSRLAGQRIRHFAGGDTCAMQHHLPQHRRHDARGARTDRVFNVGEIFFQNAAFIVGHLGDVARSDAHAVVGKHAEGRGLLQRRNFRRPERHWKIYGNAGGNAKAVRVVDHRLNADAVGKLERGNVSGLGESAPQRDGALKFVVVVVWRIRAGGSLKGYRRVQNSVIGAAALVNRCGVDVWLERRPDLAQSLRGAVELGEIEVTTADHGLDLSGRVIDGDERPFGP